MINAVRGALMEPNERCEVRNIINTCMLYVCTELTL
jgi:hypothetical protein